MRGRCPQAHTVPRVQAQGQTPSQNGLSHIFCKTPEPIQPQAITACVTFARNLSQESTLIRIFWALQSFVRGNDWVFEVLFPPAPVVSFFFPKCDLCELDHSVPPPCPWLPSLPRRLLLFGSHSAFWLLLLGSSLGSESTILPIHSLQFRCELLGRRHASPHLPAAAPICRT